MRYLLPLVAVLLTGTAFGQRPAVGFRPGIAVKPFVPPRPAPPGTPIPLVIYPNLQAYFASAFFFNDFPRQYAMRYGRVIEPVEEQPPPPALDPTQVVVTINVPEVAEVWVEGYKLQSTGATREFVSPPLAEDQTYKYNVVVRWAENNKQIERKMDIPIRPGERPSLTVLAPLRGK